MSEVTLEDVKNVNEEESFDSTDVNSTESTTKIFKTDDGEVEILDLGKTSDPVEDVTENNLSFNDNTKRFAIVKFYYDGQIIYRFDLWTSLYGNDKVKLVELKNIINNFESIVPDTPRHLKTFFAVIGLIRYVFPKTAFEIPIEIDYKSVCVTLENSVKQYIKLSKLKRMSISIDIEED